MDRPSSLRLEQLQHELIQPFSFTLQAAEVCCIQGASGSGKSRLLRALADLEPHQGEVWLGELNQQACPAHLWRQHVRLVSAESQWWSDQVRDHFPADYAADDWPQLGLPATALDWAVSRLSSGEKQRLGLLRALAWPLQALLLDEPTANLDPATTLQVEAWLLDQIRQHGWPVFWIAHDPAQVARVADHRLVLQQGRMQELSHERD